MDPFVGELLEQRAVEQRPDASTSVGAVQRDANLNGLTEGLVRPEPPARRIPDDLSVLAGDEQPMRSRL